MIRIGIIGCGKIAQVRHLPEYAANPHVELAGYYDLNTQRAQELAAQYGGKVYKSYFDLLNDPSIDAVSICVENRSHAEITTYALYAGKHVLCEKPMAVTLAECESMVAAAERNGKHLMIGHNMRFDPVHRKAKELLDGGIIGDIITFRTTMGNAGPENWSMEAGSTWFFDKQKAAMGALSDLGIHKVDLLQYLTGHDSEQAHCHRRAHHRGRQRPVHPAHERRRGGHPGRQLDGVRPRVPVHLPVRHQGHHAHL